MWTQDMTTRHLNQLDLSRRWRISPRTLEAWRWRGEGPPYLKICGRILYRIEDVEAHEAASLIAGKASSPAGGSVDPSGILQAHANV